MSVVEESSRQLILSCQGLVKTIAVRIHSNAPRSVDLDDLIGYGELGLAEAARSFDPSRGIQFSTFAYYRIRGAIFDGLAKMTWPSRARVNQLLYERNAGEVLSEAASENEPEDCSLERRAKRFGRVTESLFVTYLTSHLNSDDEEQLESMIEDTATLPPSVVAARRENCRMLRELIKALPEDAHQLIYNMYFDGQNLVEAAEKLGISKSWASRLHARTLGRLADSLRRMGVED